METVNASQTKVILKSHQFSFCLPPVLTHSKMPSWCRGKHSLLFIRPSHLLSVYFFFLPLILCLLPGKERRWGTGCGTFCFIPMSLRHISHFPWQKWFRACPGLQLPFISPSKLTDPQTEHSPAAKACPYPSQSLACEVIFCPKYNFSDNEYNLKKLYSRSSHFSP